jgi:hypothetical protein
LSHRCYLAWRRKFCYYSERAAQIQSILSRISSMSGSLLVSRFDDQPLPRRCDQGAQKHGSLDQDAWSHKSQDWPAHPPPQTQPGLLLPAMTRSGREKGAEYATVTDGITIALVWHRPRVSNLFVFDSVRARIFPMASPSSCVSLGLMSAQPTRGTSSTCTEAIRDPTTKVASSTVRIYSCQSETTSLPLELVAPNSAFIKASETRQNTISPSTGSRLDGPTLRTCAEGRH